ncbi:MAG: metalloregulator ArsR/SmtB family transcription factor [Minisyncoccia bacterium]
MKKYEVFKILGEETRFEIVQFLSGVKASSCGDLSKHFPKLSQPTLSHHFKVLADAGIISVIKDGTSHIYNLNHSFLKKLGIEIRK